jgi:hypothetical protein
VLLLQVSLQTQPLVKHEFPTELPSATVAGLGERGASTLVLFAWRWSGAPASLMLWGHWKVRASDQLCVDVRNRVCLPHFPPSCRSPTDPLSSHLQVKNVNSWKRTPSLLAMSALARKASSGSR